MDESSLYHWWVAFFQAMAAGKRKGLQWSLTTVLEHRFGRVPPQVEARIQTTSESNVLQAAIQQALTIATVDELQL